MLYKSEKDERLIVKKERFGGLLDFYYRKTGCVKKVYDCHTVRFVKDYFLMINAV